MLKLISRNLIVNRFNLVRKMSKNTAGDRIVWMDMEMTGLEVDKCRVLEVAMVVTDSELNVISKEFAINIKQTQEVIDGMNEWCKENLKDVAKNSLESDISEAKAEELMLDFIKLYVPQPQASPLAGNTIYMDRMFLKKYFPRVDSYLHYRLIDVSSVKEICRRWNKDVYNSAPQKSLKHRALEDVNESIAELKFYKENFFKLPSTTNQ